MTIALRYAARSDVGLLRELRVVVNMSAKQRRMVEWDFAKDDIRG